MKTLHFKSRLLANLVAIVCMTFCLATCHRPNASPKTPAMIELPSGAKVKVSDVFPLGSEYAMVSPDTKTSATPLFAFTSDGKVMFLIATNGTGYEVYPLNHGKRGVVIHSSNLGTPAESISVTRFVTDRDGRMMQIDYDDYGEIKRRTPVP